MVDRISSQRQATLEVLGSGCQLVYALSDFQVTRKITPHTFRHTTAMHLLQSGVDLNMIRSWLGHASIETTNLYIEIDLEMKQKTLQASEKLLPKTGKKGPSWRRDPSVLEWLATL